MVAAMNYENRFTRKIPLTEKLHIGDELHVHLISSLYRMELNNFCVWFPEDCPAVDDTSSFRIFKGENLPLPFSSFNKQHEFVSIKLEIELPPGNMQQSFVTNMELDYSEIK